MSDDTEAWVPEKTTKFEYRAARAALDHLTNMHVQGKERKPVLECDLDTLRRLRSRDVELAAEALNRAALVEQELFRRMAAGEK